MDTKKKILLIDGDQNFGNAVGKALNSKKYNFLYANSGNTGLQLAFDHQPDLILYNLDLDPVGGHDVFRTFKTTSFIRTSQVKFMCDKAYNKKKSHSIDLKEIDVMVKPDNADVFIKSIESWIKDTSLPGDERSDDFNALFQLSPYGVFLCDTDGILKANSFLLDLIDREQDFNQLRLEEIFDKSSFLKIRQWIKHYSNDNNSAFNGPVVVRNRRGGEYPLSLKLFEFKAGSLSEQFVGFVFQAVSEKNVIVNYQLVNEVCNMLKRENLAITDSLEKKITQIIKSHSVDTNNENKAFFTKRENEVLRLTMEGLSIKVIADKLSISSRTVEKYRTKLMEKSGAKNIVEVIVFSLKNNLVKI